MSPNLVRRHQPTAPERGHDAGRILYLGYYAPPGPERAERHTAPAGIQKMDYVLTVLRRLGYEPVVVSGAMAKRRWRRGGWASTPEGAAVRLVWSPPGRSGALAGVSHALANLSVLRYLLQHAERDRPVLVYHSLGYLGAVRLARRLRRFRLVLQVEEVYGDAATLSRRARRAERRVFADADCFLLSTQLLAAEVDTAGRPYAVVHGAYLPAARVAEPPDDGRTHVVYAGIVDLEKRGAFEAVAAARYLDARFTIDVAGFGDPTAVRHLVAEIDAQNRVADCPVTFTPSIDGPEYVRFLQRHQIGLSTQRPDGGFNKSSFPSKILAYLTNGLAVVSISVPSVRHSEVSDAVRYYERPGGAALADAIRSAARAASPAAVTALLTTLDERFSHDLAALLGTSAAPNR